jgi:hypothetical protein
MEGKSVTTNLRKGCHTTAPAGRTLSASAGDEQHERRGPVRLCRPTPTCAPGHLTQAAEESGGVEFDDVAVGEHVVGALLLAVEGAASPQAGVVEACRDVLVHQPGEVEDGVTLAECVGAVHVGRLAGRDLHQERRQTPPKQLLTSSTSDARDITVFR